jgi:hypothetical protein
VDWAAPQLDRAFHDPDAAFDAIAKIETLLESVLIFVGGAFWGRSSGLWEDGVLDAQAACQAFIVCREEAAVACQHMGSVPEA